MIITIDGPGGTGKSTIAKQLSQVLGVTYFDTGALYRAIAWKILHDQVALSDQEGMQKLLENFMFDISDEKGQKHYFVEGKDVSDAIRSEKVTKMSSEASTLKSVRAALRPIQIQASLKGDTIFEGRDLGTVVFPQAELKFFLTAPLNVRAKRRFKELKEKFHHKKEKVFY